MSQAPLCLPSLPASSCRWMNDSMHRLLGFKESLNPGKTNTIAYKDKNHTKWWISEFCLWCSHPRAGLLPRRNIKEKPVVPQESPWPGIRTRAALVALGAQGAMLFWPEGEDSPSIFGSTLVFIIKITQSCIGSLIPIKWYLLLVNDLLKQYFVFSARI